MCSDDNPKQDKHRRIIESAAHVFARKGYTGASVADIAVAAGIGKGTVYEYFKSKEALFFAVFEWYSQKMRSTATVSVAALAGSVAERLAALNDGLMNQWHEIRDVFTLVMEFWAASASFQMRQRFQQAFKQTYEDFRSLVTSMIRDGIQGGEFQRDINPTAVAAALVGTWDALFLQAWFDESFDPLATAREFLEVVVRGLKAAPDV